MFDWITACQRWVDRKDNHMIVPKAIFLLLNTILCVTYTYQLDYINDDWKLDISSSGYITCIPAFSFFCSIAWSTFAQRTGCYKGIILFAACSYSLLFSGLYFLQPFFQDHSEHIRLSVLFTIYGLMSVISSALFPLLDHTIYVKLNKDERFSPESFGRLRLWGTVGQGLAGFFSGQLKDVYKGYGAVFGLSFVLSLMFLMAVSLGIDSEEEGKERKEEKKTKGSASWGLAVKKLMGLEFICFLFVVLAASYSRSIVGNYLMRYLVTYLGIKQNKSSFLLLVRTIPEILCFFFTKNLLQILGVTKLLFLAQLAGLIRVATYAWLPKSFTWAPFVVESLRGANNAFLYASGVRLAYELAPTESQAISQGFFHGIFGNLTTGLAGIIGTIIGLVVKSNNPSVGEAEIFRVNFQISALASVLGLLIFLAFYLVSKDKLQVSVK